MIGTLDFDTVVFGAPQFLWLLAVPGLLLVAWVWRLARRLSDLRLLRARRTTPVKDRCAPAGDLPFWLAVIVAAACLIVALARPQGPSTAIGRAGVDLVVIQDGSASMQVADLAGAEGQGKPSTRWRRSMQFVRDIGNALSWNDDRMGLTVFAHIATPQIRLTRDPNTLFFFLDHLQGRPPFRLEDDTTWDTNLEQGLRWGLRLLDKDREIHGPSARAKIFALISDGESWTGEVARSLSRTADAHVPVYVVGVGTLGGGMLPEYTDEDGPQPSPGRSRLDRASLQRIATAGGGQYFELDREPDREIANALIDAGRRSAPVVAGTGEVTELYWRFLAAAVVWAWAGLIFLRDRAALWLQLAAAVAAFVIVGRLLW